MRKLRSAFRVVWGLNAVVLFVLLTAGAVSILSLVFTTWRRPRGRDEPRENALVVVEDEQVFRLDRFEAVPGSDVLNADLRAEDGSGSFKSGPSFETRNTLFIDRGKASARWLLPDHHQVMVDSQSFLAEEGDCQKRRTLAHLVLVRPAAAPTREAGVLLAYDPTGSRVVEVGRGVSAIHDASLATDGALRVLFEREGHLVDVELDPETLLRRTEREIVVPSVG